MRRVLMLVLVLVSFGAYALDVDEQELQQLGTRDINFINYTGPHTTIDTADEILGIGRSLGSSINVGPVRNEFTFNGKYRVVHAVDPQTTEGLDADIIMPLSTARVDHIDNLRRILSGFLQTAYSYSPTDADLIAKWITVYNALARGNMDLFNQRYKSVVTENLTPETAGLSRRYDEWPGKSRIVIPLSSGAGPGVLGSVEPSEVAGPQVVEQLRSQEDRGVEDRQNMTDLTDRVINEREQANQQEQQAIQQEQQRIDQEQQAIQQDQQALDQASQEAEQLPADQQQDQLDQRQQQVQQDQAAVEQRAEDLAQSRQDVADLTEQVRAEREQIARDTRALLDERQISEDVRGLQGDLSPIYFLQVRDQSGVILGQLVQINPVTGLLLNRSGEDQIVSRSYTFHNGELLVIVADGDVGRLAHLDVTSLAETATGTNDVFLASALRVYGDPAAVYAIVKDTGGWYLGRFGDDLALIDRSVIAVNPYTTLAFGGNKVWVQTSDDRVVALGLEDLRIAP